MSQRANIVSELRSILGSDYVLTSDSDLQEYGRDWTREVPPNPLCIVLPAGTSQVSEVVKFCAERDLAVVPSGGRTGLAGGAVASQGEVVLSLARLNRIHSVDEVNLSAEVDAGVTNQALQMEHQNPTYNLIDLRESSCQRRQYRDECGESEVYSHGGTREHVLGLEVVLASGQVLDLKRSLRKNNTGYDLMQCFIGSEGTLGIITKAVLRVVPTSRNPVCALLAVESFGVIPEILMACRHKLNRLNAFEFFSLQGLEAVLEAFPMTNAPFEAKSSYYVLLELEQEPGSSGLETAVEELFEKSLIVDGVFSTSSSEFNQLWSLRENITEALSILKHVHKNDVSVPIGALDDFIRETNNLVQTNADGPEVILFGHVGDGNVHINYVVDKKQDYSKFVKEVSLVEQGVFELVAKHRGSISAEHGIDF